MPWNGTQAYTITPAANHHVSDVLVDGVSVGAVTSYTFSSVTADPHHLGHLRRRHQHHHDGSGRQRLHHPVVSQRRLRGQPDLPDRARHPPPRRRRGGRRRVAGSDRVLHLQQRHRRATPSRPPSPSTPTPSPRAPGANGSVTPAGVTAVPWNGTQAYTITPAANHHVSDVLVDGVSVGAVTSYTFSNVTAAHTISATFAVDTNTITASAGRQRLRHPGRRDGRALERDAGLHDHPGGQPPRLRRARRRRVGRRGDLLHLQQRARPPTPSRPPSPSTPTPSPTSSGRQRLHHPGRRHSVDHWDGTQTFTDHARRPTTTSSTWSSTACRWARSSSYTFSNVTAAHTISATFAVDTNTITASAGANGSVTPAGVTAVPWNGTQAYTITPAANHHVSTCSLTLRSCPRRRRTRSPT